MIWELTWVLVWITVGPISFVQIACERDSNSAAGFCFSIDGGIRRDTQKREEGAPDSSDRL